MTWVTDLATAIDNDNLPLVRELLNQQLRTEGSNINSQNDRFLIYAVQVGRLSIVQEFLDREADIHARDKDPLIYAASYNRPDIVRELLQRGPGEAGIHAQGELSLKMAAQNNYPLIVKILLDGGADLTVQVYNQSIDI